MKFYDTCSLLLKVNSICDDEEKFLISSITLKELENIKTSSTKDPSIKYDARKVLHMLNNNPEAYDVIIFNTTMLIPFTQQCLEVTDDIRILSSAFWYKENTDQDLIFVTDDLALKHIAQLFFSIDHITSIGDTNIDSYAGYLEVTMTDEEMSDFYSAPTENKYNLYINQYLNIYNTNHELVDTTVWTGNGYRRLYYGTFDSQWFGKIKPIKTDIYQAMVADSLINNKITMVKGPAGSGKTYLSLGYLMHLLDHGKIDKIIIFCNTVATRNSAKLGYLPGTRDEKLLDSQIGNLLSSKIGGRVEVERLIQDEKLLLLPLSDIRGYDTSNMHAGIYISEAQNLDITLMKLALQRIGNDSICIIDGDEKTQVDDINFAGANNGMRRASQVFRGEDIYGEIELKNVHRSKIAQIAEQM